MKGLAERFADLSSEQSDSLRRQLEAASDTVGAEPIAVIGVGCRFPGGASGPNAYWRLLHDGHDAVAEIPPGRWDAQGCYDLDPQAPGKSNSRWAGLLDDVSGFDAEYFGITPREAGAMDPQQRLLLEVAIESLEDAGLDLPALRGSSTGLFAGVYYHDYQSLGDHDAVDAYTTTGNAHSVTVGRVAYRLDLRGPSIAIDTACSSSLVALHLACQSLRLRESDVALAGGVSLMLAPETHLSLTRWGMLSPRGQCRSFDDEADGFVRGEGCGLIVLKRLADAVRDHDTVLAVVRGTAVNSDGQSQGLTAPNGVAQRAVMDRAVAAAGIDPRQVGLIETHGTGTPVGDPIEFEALGQVYGRGSGACALGAVKSNLGHLEAAAGAAAVIKAVLALRHGIVPPNLHFTAWNREMRPEGLRLFVPTEATPWPVSGPRLAAISAFGFGGTNAHIILEAGASATISAEHREPRTWNHTPHWVHPVPAAPDSSVPAAWLQKVTWRTAPLEPTRPTADRWLVVAETTSDSEVVASNLRERGVSALAGSIADIELLPGEVDRVAFLAEQGPADSASQRSHLIAGHLLRIVHALRNAEPGPRLHIVTRGAFAPDGGAPDPAQATLTGWARGLSLEDPDLWGGLVDTDDLTGVADQLLAEVSAADDDDQVAYRRGVRQVPRLVPAEAGKADPDPLAGPGTHLVVGANGAIGGRLVRHLVELGASHLTLVSRRGVVGPLVDTVNQLTEQGVVVVDLVADAADPKAMGALFGRFGGDLPALAGVVAAAFAGGPVPMEELDDIAVAEMFRPKVDATALLDRLSRSHPVRTFLLFSSTTGLLGSRQLAHYAATGAFLDALAEVRAAEGLPSTVIDWGIWASRLAAADPKAQAQVVGSGLLPMDDDVAVRVLGPLLSQGAATRTMVAAADWSLLASAYGSRHRLRIIEDLAQEAQLPASGAKFLTELMDSDPALRTGLLRDHVRREASAVMRIASPEDLPTDAGFFQIGMDSLMSVQFLRSLSASLGLDLTPTMVFNHPTVDDLTEELILTLGLRSRNPADGSPSGTPRSEADLAEPVAVVGIGCRLPGGAHDSAQFWDLLSQGKHGIVEVPASRWDIDAYHHEDYTVPGTICSRHGGFLTDWRPEEFDADFFDIAPREAEAMDPQQRLVLEVAVEALANAGLQPQGLRGTRTGVFIGMTTHDYLIAQVRDGGSNDVDAYTSTGSAANFSAGRVAYQLGLQGPALAVDTACSSSLTATHLALQALRTGDADVALAGGVNLMLTPDASISFSRWGMLSKSGACRSFDDTADGFVRGEGCGVLILKRLRDAERDGDRILAVVLGSAIDQDGRSSGQTVPNGLAQEAVIREALRRSSLLPEDIDYIEGHGAGTPLGDPIELEALGAVFCEDRAADHPLIVGSVKTNIGHTEACAGVAGMIKTVLSLHEGVIPPHPDHTRLTSRIGQRASQIVVPTQAQPWPDRARPARAGVSAFGASGTNVHIVLEQAPAAAPTEHGGVWLFSGQGSQWPGMGAGLLQDEPAFAQAIAEMEPMFEAEVGISLTRSLGSDREIEGIDLVQPLLFAMQIGLAAVWRSYGVQPDAVIGHSMGEVAASVVAGALPLEDGVRVIARRSHLLRTIAGNGAMAVLERNAAEVEEMTADLPGVEVAVYSSPGQTVVSGERAAVESLVERETAQDRFARLILVDVASHSSQVDPLLAELAGCLGDLDPRHPQVPFLSTVTDTEPAFDAAYWVANLRRPVRFSQAVAQALALGHSSFIEISPHPLLTNAVLDTAAGSAVVTPSLRRDLPTFTPALPVELPPPVWNRRPFWFNASPVRPDGHPLIGAGVVSPDGRWTFTSEVGSARLPWLADHAINSRPVMPAAVWVEVAVAAAATALGVAPQQVRLRGIELEKLLLVEEHTRITVVLTPEGEHRASIGIHTCASDGSWIRHCAAKAAIAPDRQESASQAPSGPGVGTEMDPADLYARLRSVGQEHGPAFRSVTGVRLFQDGTVTGDLQLPNAATACRREMHIPPVLLDGALQLLAATLQETPDTSAGGSLAALPARIGQVDVLGDVRSATRASASLEPTGDPDRFVGQVTLADAGGAPLLRLGDIEIVRLGLSAPQQPADPVYEAVWRAEPLPARPDTAQPGQAAGERFVIVAEDVTDPVVAGLGAEPAVDLVAAGDDDALVAALRTPARGVVLVAARNVPCTAPLTAAHRCALTAADVARTVLTAGLRDVPRLYLVSFPSTGPEDSGPAELAHTTWRGIARVLAYEHPELRATLLDLDPQADPGKELAAELRGGDREVEVSYRAGVRRVARLAQGQPAARLLSRRLDAARTPFALRCPEPAGPGSLRLEVAELAPPGPGELTVRVEAAGINFSDVLKVHGAYPCVAGDPFWIGGEFAGTVTATGEGITDLSTGDRVMGLATESFASQVRTSRELVAMLPADLDAIQAATIPVAFATAWYALHHVVRVQPGQRVLIHSATGGVGLAALAIARNAGARVLVTAGSEAKRDYLRDLGITDVYDSRSLAAFDQIEESVGSVDVVLNTLPGEAMRRGLALLASGGHFVELGKADTYGHTALDLGLLAQGCTLTTIDLDRSLRQRPALGRQLLEEVLAEMAAGRLSPLPAQTFEISQAVPAFELMARAGHIGKVVLTVPASGEVIITSRDGQVAGPEGAYIVTGGLGGLGLVSASWLCERGAGRLVLNGRRAPDDHAQEVIRTIREAGTQVEVVLGDIADRDTADRVVQAAIETGHALRGVIHSAAVLEDGTLLRLRGDALARVLAPKVGGAWQLHEATSGHELDFFVLYSSAASLLGSPGQTAYAAANAWLDALASHRQAQGLPGLAINWGPWGEVGQATDFAARGYQVLSTAQGLAQLGRLITSDLDHAGVFTLDARRWEQAFPAIAGSPYFAEVSVVTAPTPPRGRAQIDLQSVPEAQRLTRLTDYLVGEVSTVLRRGREPVDLQAPFASLGLDSLMALELRNRLETGLGLTLPATIVWACPTVAALAEDLAGRLGLTPEPAEPEPTQDLSDADADLLNEITAHLAAETDEGADGVPAR